MEQYDQHDIFLGDGSFSDVSLVTHKKTGEKRALKRLKIRPESLDWLSFISLREIQVLKVLPIHPNVVTLFDIIFAVDGSYFLTFEYAEEGCLLDYIQRLRDERLAQNNPPNQHHTLLPEAQIESILRDTLNGLNHIHSQGFFHRDIKPANLLLFSDGSCKVGDFTLARFQLGARTDSCSLTAYVSTRWYRAPELLLESPAYGAPVDIFATGCVAVEIITGDPLFPGTSVIDQLSLILGALGVPTFETWPDGVQLMTRMGLSCNETHNGRLDFPFFLSETFKDFIRRMLALNPDNRPSASEALAHAFFHPSGGQALQGVSSSDAPSSSFSTTSSPRPSFLSPTSTSIIRGNGYAPDVDVPPLANQPDDQSPASVLQANLADSTKPAAPKSVVRNPYRKRKAET